MGIQEPETKPNMLYFMQHEPLSSLLPKPEEKCHAGNNLHANSCFCSIISHQFNRDLWPATVATYAIAGSIFFPLTDFHSTRTEPMNESAAMASDV